MTMGAQRIVLRGYKNCLRRNYLVQLVNDDDALAKAKPLQKDLDAFLKQRANQWLNDGVIPRSVFFSLIIQWRKSGALTGGPTSANSINAVTPVAKSTLPFSVDIGLTFSGFQALEAHSQFIDLLRVKAPAFSEGAFYRASNKLGDSGASDPQYWRKSFKGSSLHAVLIVHSENSFDAFEDAVAAAMSDGITALDRNTAINLGTCPATREWVEQGGLISADTTEHFGFKDGITKPFYEGVSDPSQEASEDPSNVHKAGELLLGYERNDKSNPWQPTGARAQETGNIDPQARPSRLAYDRFFKDGTFGVLRTMRQDVKAFNAFIDNAVKAKIPNEERLADESDEVFSKREMENKRNWVKAKMLGRYPDGKPLTLQDPGTGQNKFNFASDRQGLQCPFAAHIRRMNPRDDPVVPFIRRPLLRRGVIYGPAYIAKDADLGTDSQTERGMLGLFFCSSIEEQFEHVLGNWGNNSPLGIPGQEHGKDPLIGTHDLPRNDYLIPMQLENGSVSEIRLRGMRDFVSTRGTCYALFPSGFALDVLAKGVLENAEVFLKP